MYTVDLSDTNSGRFPWCFYKQTFSSETWSPNRHLSCQSTSTYVSRRCLHKNV